MVDSDLSLPGAKGESSMGLGSSDNCRSARDSNGDMTGTSNRSNTRNSDSTGNGTRNGDGK